MKLVVVSTRYFSASDALGGSGRARRSTTVGYLEICSPPVAEIYGYWNRKRGERAMPRRPDVDPFEITRHLPGLQLRRGVQGVSE